MNKKINRPEGRSGVPVGTGAVSPRLPFGVFYFMEQCFKCQNKALRYKDIDFYSIWMCDNCGQSGVVYTYPKCCNNPQMIDVRSETSDGKWQRRSACKTCKKLSGRALKNGEGFNALPFLTYEKNMEYETMRMELHKKCMSECEEFTEEYKRKSYLIKKMKYDQYLQSPQWKIKAEIVKERDNHLCQMCLMSRATDVHHLTYKRIFNELTSDLISVCRKCHDKIHNK